MTSTPIASTSPAERTRRGRTAGEHPGPPLGAPAIAFVVTFVASIFVGPLSGAGVPPSPFASTTEIVEHFRTAQTATTISAFLMLLSAVPLVLLSAVVWSRLNFLAPNAPGPAIAAVGGVSAALLLVVSAITIWVAPRIDADAPAALITSLHDLQFAAGGFAHVAALGVMILGIAVTTWFVNRTPSILSWIGIGLGVIDLLSTITMLTDVATPLIPLGRFLSMAWLVVMSLLIPRDRGARRSDPAALRGAERR